MLVWPMGIVRAETPMPLWTEVGSKTVEVQGRRWIVTTVEGRLPASGGEVRADRADVWVYIPSTVTWTGVVLGLPGWKFAARTWEDKARISDHAEALGVVVALADMNTTVYESAFYPESRADRRWCGVRCAIPGSEWVGRILAPYLVDTYGSILGMFGLSTGGRGAVLVSQHYPELAIGRVCSMSGTYDLDALQPGTGEYKIHANVYGERPVHPERWAADDSLKLVERLDSVELLLIHGTEDPYVPSSQSDVLFKAMSSRGAQVRLVPVVGGGHDWKLWSGYLRSCLDFLMRAEE